MVEREKPCVYPMKTNTYFILFALVSLISQGLGLELSI